MPPSRRYFPVTLSLHYPCPRCRRDVFVTTTNVATSAGDRAIACDELQAKLNLKIDLHEAFCAARPDRRSLRVQAKTAESLL